MSESLTSYVRGVNRPGAKSKAVTLAKNADGEALWVWVPKDTIVVPGMTFHHDNVGFGKLETTYTDAKGNEVTLNVPKRQVFCYGENLPVFDVPEAEAVVTEVVVTDAAREYAEKYAAAQTRAEDADDDDDAPF